MWRGLCHPGSSVSLRAFLYDLQIIVAIQPLQCIVQVVKVVNTTSTAFVFCNCVSLSHEIVKYTPFQRYTHKFCVQNSAQKNR